jgi:folate-binding protein YgfZ
MPGVTSTAVEPGNSPANRDLATPARPTHLRCLERQDARDAVVTAAARIELPDRGVLSIRGLDARSFLQGLVSNDVTRLTPERALYAALLTPQGKYLFDFILFDAGPEILLDAEAARMGEFAQRLKKYRLRAKVEVEDRSGEFAVVALLGEGAIGQLGMTAEPGRARPLDSGVVAVDPRLPALGARAILPRGDAAATLAGLALAPAPFEVWERRRLELGVPASGRDLVPQKSTLLESNFEALHGVDFAKGCYVGQELTARTKYRALVRKRLLPARLEGPCPAPGTPVLLGEEDAGEIRSGLDDRAIALLRLAAWERWRREGGTFRAGETRVFPEWPAWLAAEMPAGG